MRYNDDRDDGDHDYPMSDVAWPCGVCPLSFDFCRCSPRKTYLTPYKRIEQAKRILPIVEAEISGGETRLMFFEIRDMCLRDLEEE